MLEMASTFETNDPDVIIISDDEQDKPLVNSPPPQPPQQTIPDNTEIQNTNNKRKRSAAVLTSKRCQEHSTKTEQLMKTDTDENSNASMDCDVPKAYNNGLNGKEGTNEFVKKQPLANSNSRKSNSNTNGVNCKNSKEEDDDDTLKKVNYSEDSEGNKNFA